MKNKTEKFGLENAKPRATPCETSGYKVVSEVGDDISMYREMVGSIIYAMTCTRPDLSWVVTKLSQHLNDPTAVDSVMLKHVFRYLLGTLDYNLTFRKSELLIPARAFKFYIEINFNVLWYIYLIFVTVMEFVTNNH